MRPSRPSSPHRPALPPQAIACLTSPVSVHALGVFSRMPESSLFPITDMWTPTIRPFLLPPCRHHFPSPRAIPVVQVSRLVMPVKQLTTSALNPPFKPPHNPSPQSMALTPLTTAHCRLPGAPLTPIKGELHPRSTPHLSPSLSSSLSRLPLLSC
jgi:hypothetical protein